MEFRELLEVKDEDGSWCRVLDVDPDDNADYWLLEDARGRPQWRPFDAPARLKNPTPREMVLLGALKKIATSKGTFENGIVTIDGESFDIFPAIAEMSQGKDIETPEWLKP